MQKNYLLLLILCAGIFNVTKAQTNTAKKTMKYAGNEWEVYAEDDTKIPWGRTGYSIGTSSKSNGKANTSTITAKLANWKDQSGNSYAAKYCNDLKAEGNDDWYLPSLDELNLVFKFKIVDKYKNDPQGVFTNIDTWNQANYWSSTEESSTEVWRVNLFNGQQVLENKVLPAKACCVRKVNSLSKGNVVKPKIHTVEVGSYKIMISSQDNTKSVYWVELESASLTHQPRSQTMDGEKDSKAIVDLIGDQGGKTYAAYICDTLKFLGYNDWYLPSLGEFKAIKVVSDSLNLVPNYWSSTMITSANAITAKAYVYYPNKKSMGPQAINAPAAVRCVRKVK